MTLKDRLEQIAQLEGELEMPYDVWRVFGKCELFGSQVCFGPGDNDYASADELKVAVMLLAEQLGGTVTWASAPKATKAKKTKAPKAQEAKA